MKTRLYIIIAVFFYFSKFALSTIFFTVWENAKMKIKISRVHLSLYLFAISTARQENNSQFSKTHRKINKLFYSQPVLQRMIHVHKARRHLRELVCINARDEKDEARKSTLCSCTVTFARPIDVSARFRNSRLVVFFLFVAFSVGGGRPNGRFLRLFLRISGYAAILKGSLARYTDSPIKIR